MKNVRKEFEQQYQDLYGRYARVISDFIDQHPSPEELFQPKIESLQKKYLGFPYRFRYIIKKYYLNVTLELRRFPRVSYICTVCQFILHKKYNPRYKKTITDYLAFLKEELDVFRKKFPSYEINEEFVSQIIKVIYACLLSTYIRQPLIRTKKHWKQLDQTFYYGLYIALLYLISDHFLDDDQVEAMEKEKYNENGLRFLSGDLDQVIPDIDVYKASEHVVLRLADKFPFHSHQTLYRDLYFLQKAQFDDLRCVFQAESFDSIKKKTIGLGMKTFLSFVIMLPVWGRNKTIFSKDAFLFSLYTQLDDDMRDANEDRRNNVRTFFSHPMYAKTFNPYIFVIHLVEYFISKNKDLKWMYADLLNHLNKNEDSESMDKEKIRIFIRKVVEKDLSEIIHYLNR